MGKILIVADMHSNCYATPRGLDLSDKLRRQVEIVAFAYAPLKGLKATTAERSAIRKRLLVERERAVRVNIVKHQRPGQKVSVKVVWEKNIDRWIIKHCANGRYDGVLKAGSRTQVMVHSSTDWQLLRECPAPVLLVADRKWHRTKPVQVALDLASNSRDKQALNRKVLMAGRDLAAALEVELEVITAIEVPTLLADLDLVDPHAYAEEAKADMQPRIQKFATEFDLPESVFHCKRGPVEKVITSHAAKVRAQIVVMGTVARTGVKARLLGNTAERVLRHLKTDVLAIKP